MLQYEYHYNITIIMKISHLTKISWSSYFQFIKLHKGRDREKNLPANDTIFPKQQLEAL